MKHDEKYIIKCRYGLVIQKLLLKNKKLNAKTDGVIDDSYGKISSSTGLRPATISAIINAKSELKAYTLYQLLETLGYTYTQFGKVFDAITDDELKTYIAAIGAKKSPAKKTAARKKR